MKKEYKIANDNPIIPNSVITLIGTDEKEKTPSNASFNNFLIEYPDVPSILA